MKEKRKNYRNIGIIKTNCNYNCNCDRNRKIIGNEMRRMMNSKIEEEEVRN